jgi:hypothetical protein
VGRGAGREGRKLEIMIRYYREGGWRERGNVLYCFNERLFSRV